MDFYLLSHQQRLAWQYDRVARSPGLSGFTARDNDYRLAFFWLVVEIFRGECRAVLIDAVAP